MLAVAPAPRAQFGVFSLAYLADYPLTLLATSTPGFREENPITGALWNAGDTTAPLLLKLVGLGLVAIGLVLLADRKRMLQVGFQAATLVFVVVDAMSLIQLHRIHA